jgi:uncharacterized protein YlxW (UPF0749 family)
MNLEKLKARREKLAAQIKQIDAELAKAERAQREAEQRELVKLIQSRGITTARLAAILDAAPGVVGTGGDAE